MYVIMVVHDGVTIQCISLEILNYYYFSNYYGTFFCGYVTNCF
jgi:hypothetical protein